MAREPITLKLSASVNRPLAYLGAVLSMAGAWLLRNSIKVRTRGT